MRPDAQASSIAGMQVALDEAVASVTRAGEAIAELWRHQAFEVQQKHGTELVTTADLRSDQVIRAHLHSCFPQHRFLSEEVDVAGTFDFTGHVWVIDPIDGTTNYVHGNPYVGISVALVIDGEPRVGVVHAPFLGETFTAVRGLGARCNGLPIRVSSTSELRRALVGTGFPHDRSDVTRPVERVRRLVSACQDIRRAGSPALDICSVAAGRLDAHCETLAPWDIAAAGLIATEAGALRGASEASDGWPPELRGTEFVVATPAIFEPLCRLLSAP